MPQLLNKPTQFLFVFFSVFAFCQAPRFRVDVVGMYKGPVFTKESGRDTDGNAFVAAGGDFYLVPLFNPKLEPQKITLPPKVTAQTWDSGFLKYRNGSFFSRTGNSIVEFDPKVKEWRKILHSPRSFVQFEVNWVGQVLIIQPGGPLKPPRAKPPREPGTKGPSNTTDPKGDETPSNFIEIWEKGGNSPVREIAYPLEEHALHLMIAGLPGFTRTWSIEDSLLLYNPYSGRMYAYSGTSHSLSAIRTPWEGLSLEVLETWEKETGKYFPMAKGVPIEGIDMPMELLQVCPTPIGTTLFYCQALMPHDYKDQSLARMKPKDGGSLMPFAQFAMPACKPDEAAENPSRPRPHLKMVKAELDLEARRIKVLHTSDEILKLPEKLIWSGHDGNAIPFEEFLKECRARAIQYQGEPENRKQPPRPSSEARPPIQDRRPR